MGSEVIVSSAKTGSAEDLCRLGLLYYNGEGVKKDFRKAVHLFGKAAAQGNADAQYHLSMCYYLGIGTPKDYNKAIYWGEKAGAQGNPLAQFLLGTVYNEGLGRAVNYKKACYWFEKAAENGYADSLRKLEDMKCRKERKTKENIFSQFETSDNEAQLLKMFQISGQLIAANKIAEAEKMLEPILMSKKIYNFTSGAYARMGLLEYCLRNYIEAEKCFLKALEINPENNTVYAYLFCQYYLTGQYEKAKKIIERCNTQEAKSFLITISESVVIPVARLMKSKDGITQMNDPIREDVIKRYINLFSDDIERHYYWSYELARMYINIDPPKLLKAYDLMKNEINKVPEEPSGYAILAMLCGEAFLNLPQEHEKYAQITFSLEEKIFCNKKKTKSDDSIERVEYEAAQCELYLAYMHQNKFEEALCIIEKRLTEKITSLDLHNYALVLNALGYYEKASEQCKRSLRIIEDESGYLLLGDIFFKMEKYKEAADAYERALAFCIGGYISKFEEENGDVVLAIASGSQMKFVKEKSYQGIIKSYIKIGNYLMARAYYDFACKDFPNNNTFEGLGVALESIKSNEEMIEELREKLKLETMIAEKRSGKLKLWASELMKLQAEKEWDLNDEAEIWSVFEKRMDKIIDGMVREAGAEDHEYKEIQNKLMSKYKKLGKKSLFFLTTAEYLYGKHKEDPFIDFAPIMVEYCKVLEAELRTFLSKKLCLPNNIMLGESIKVIREKGILPFSKSIVELETIHRYRNGSAHDGISTKGKVEKVRQLYFGNVLELIEKAI